MKAKKTKHLHIYLTLEEFRRLKLIKKATNRTNSELFVNYVLNIQGETDNRSLENINNRK